MHSKISNCKFKISSKLHYIQIFFQKNVLQFIWLKAVILFFLEILILSKCLKRQHEYYKWINSIFTFCHALSIKSRRILMTIFCFQWFILSFFFSIFLIFFSQKWNILRPKYLCQIIINWKFSIGLKRGLFWKKIWADFLVFLSWGRKN